MVQTVSGVFFEHLPLSLYEIQIRRVWGKVPENRQGSTMYYAHDSPQEVQRSSDPDCRIEGVESSVQLRQDVRGALHRKAQALRVHRRSV